MSAGQSVLLSNLSRVFLVEVMYEILVNVSIRDDVSLSYTRL